MTLIFRPPAGLRLAKSRSDEHDLLDGTSTRREPSRPATLLRSMSPRHSGGHCAYEGEVVSW